MLYCLLSPAKKLDMESSSPISDHSTPALLAQTEPLIERVKKLTKDEIGELMKLSDNLSELNLTRYEQLAKEPTEQNAKAAIFSFKGDVYQSFLADTLTHDQIHYANQHIGILSGLYGLLRPLDLMQAYRLEMGTRLDTARGENLYDFWGSAITDQINQQIEANQISTVVNLASQEYSKAVDLKSLSAPVVTPVFKEISGGKAKVLGLYAKRARGAMARFVVTDQVANANGLRDFNWQGYRFDEALSSPKELVFTRPKP